MEGTGALRSAHCDLNHDADAVEKSCFHANKTYLMTKIYRSHSWIQGKATAVKWSFVNDPFAERNQKWWNQRNSTKRVKVTLSPVSEVFLTQKKVKRSSKHSWCTPPLFHEGRFEPSPSRERKTPVQCLSWPHYGAANGHGNWDEDASECEDIHTDCFCDLCFSYRMKTD